MMGLWPPKMQYQPLTPWSAYPSQPTTMPTRMSMVISMTTTVRDFA
jgi:hypothetical protein